MDAPDVTVLERLAAIRLRIDEAGGSDAVRVVGVTKGFDPEVVARALDGGIIDLGESYAQEFAAKAEALADHDRDPGPRWHFIGRLQRNKVRRVAPYVWLWQSVDRRSLADEIARRAPGAAVLIQVDATAEPAKGGCLPAEVESLVRHAASLGLEVRGLMAMGHLDNADRTAEAFATTVALADRLDLRERSMGMSDDLELAVAAGSTMVRVGTALFGPRPDRREVEH